MKSTDRITISPDHSIEWGESTWDGGADFSVRNRYDNTSTGGFNVRGSSEVPWHDFNRMIIESIDRGHFSSTELSAIQASLAKHIVK